MSTRDILMKAAFTSFLSHGYDGTGITKILSGTGLSKGAFYHHFESKLVLFEEVVDRYFPTPFAEMDWSQHAGLNVAEQKAAIADIYGSITKVSAAMEGDLRRYFTLFFDALSRLPKFRGAIDEAYTRLIGSLAEALVREDDLTPVQAKSQARAHIAAFEGQTYLWAVMGADAEPNTQLPSGEQ